jgi:putative PIN family toxin of toxin-antitoxin system
MQLDRVVFDTNIWITYFYNGEFEQLVEIVEELEIPIYSSIKLRQELTSVLLRPKLVKKLNYPTERYVAFYRQLSNEIEIDERFDRISDVKDNYIIDIAYTGKCSHVITGDPHLLSLKHVGNIQIISLADFKKIMGKLKDKLK